jgi:Fic family protein
MSGDAGQWQETQNGIIELRSDGRREARFMPVAPKLVPAAMDKLCLSYRTALDQREVLALLAVSALVLDFLCVHPFCDGNGRVSHLLTLLPLYHRRSGLPRKEKTLANTINMIFQKALKEVYCGCYLFVTFGDLRNACKLLILLVALTRIELVTS